MPVIRQKIVFDNVKMCLVCILFCRIRVTFFGLATYICIGGAKYLVLDWHLLMIRYYFPQMASPD